MFREQEVGNPQAGACKHIYTRTHTHAHKQTNNPQICDVSKSLRDGVLFVWTSTHTALTNTTQGEGIRRKQSSRDETSPQEGATERKRKRE